MADSVITIPELPVYPGELEGTFRLLFDDMSGGENSVYGITFDSVKEFISQIGRYLVQTQAEMLALSQAKVSDTCYVEDDSAFYILKELPSSALENWGIIGNPSAVQSFNGRPGPSIMPQSGDYTTLTVEEVDGGGQYWTQDRFNAAYNARLGVANGAASLRANGMLTLSQFPTDITADSIQNGTTNKFYSTTAFNADFATKTTSNLPEGSRLYYTPERAQSAMQNTSPTFGTVAANRLAVPNDGSGTAYGISFLTGGNRRSGILVRGSNRAGIFISNETSANFVFGRGSDQTDIFAAGSTYTNLHVWNRDGEYYPAATNSYALGRLSNVWGNGYFNGLLFTMGSEPDNSTFSGTNGARIYYDGTNVRIKKKTATSFEYYALSGGGGSYTDAQARNAIATATDNVLGINTVSYNFGELAPKQLNLYYAEDNRKLLYQYQPTDPEADAISYAFAQLLDDAEFLKIRANPPVTSSSTDWPTILSLPTADTNYTSGGVLNPMKTVLALGRPGQASVSGSNIAQFTIGSYSKDGTAAHTQLGIGVSHDAATEGGNPPVPVLIRSDKNVGFSVASPSALVSIGGGKDFSAGGGRVQIAFTRDDELGGGCPHTLTSVHSTAVGIGGDNQLQLAIWDGVEPRRNMTWAEDRIIVHQEVEPIETDSIDWGNAGKRIRRIYLTNAPDVSSDIRIKKNISRDLLGSMKEKGFSSATDAVQGIDAIRYKLLENQYDTLGIDGLDAMRNRFPGASAYRGKQKLTFDEFDALDAVGDIDDVSIGVDYCQVSVMLIAAFKEQVKRTNELEERLAAIEARLG